MKTVKCNFWHFEIIFVNWCYKEIGVFFVIYIWQYNIITVSNDTLDIKQR